MKPERVTVTTKDGKNHVGAYNPKTGEVSIVGGKLKKGEYKDLRPAPIVK